MQVVVNNPTDCVSAPSVSSSTYYSVKSGTGVFAAVSIGWITSGLGSVAADDARRAPERAKSFVRAATESLLSAVAAGPMGARHPSKDNIGDFDLPKANIASTS